MRDSDNISTPKRMKISKAATVVTSVNSAVVLNGTISRGTRTESSKSNHDKNTHLSFSTTKEDFFLKNENNCFYKCVLCSETVKSKPSYKTHIRMVHSTEMNKYHIQKGFVDATKEFCSEFVQTDFNIVQSLTSIFDQIDNIERIVRDHKNGLRFTNYVDNELAEKFLREEEVVLKLYGEMIQRAFDIVSEKNELITCLQEDVAELLEQNGNIHNSAAAADNSTEYVTEEQFVKEEEEPVYELYYIEDDANQKDGDAENSNLLEEVESAKKVASSKRGRPKGDLARSLNDCLSELPQATGEYIRTLTANDNSKYQCKDCDVAAKTKMLLCVHYMRVHLKIKNKICPYCSRPFASQGDLTRHIRIHSGDNPFKCDYPECTSEFKTTGDLKKHKVVHERNPLHRPFQCSECGSKFARRTDATRHQKLHLIGKMENVGFTCEICAKKFYRKDLFRAHTNYHLKIKPFECFTCLKRFAKKYDLLKHMEKQHSGGVECDDCGGEFDSRSQLVKHFNSGMCNVGKSVTIRPVKTVSDNSIG